MTARHSARFRERAASLWEAIFRHPFVTGIGDGSLPVEKFRFYMGQDYVFLVEYCRVLALAATKAPDLQTMGKFAELLHATLNTEMALHRSYAAQFGIPAEELERIGPAPTAHAYTRHLLTVASTGTMADLAAALLPCQWGYCEIGQRLARGGKPDRQPLYGQWIDTYASAEFAALAEWLRGLFDRLADGLPPADLDRLETLYRTSIQYEYLFWDMAYRQERWPL